MAERLYVPVVTAVLTLAVVIVFSSILNEPQDVVPLFLVPVFLYVGCITGKAGTKAWIVSALKLTIALAIFYTI